MRYVLFVKDNCPFCVKAREFLEDRSLPYKEVMFEEDQTNILNEIKEVYSWKTVPMIFCRDKDQVNFIGGYTDLVRQLGSDVKED